MAKHGKFTQIWLDDASGTPVEITQYHRSADASESIDTAETSNFGQNAKTYVSGLSDSAPSLGGTWDPALLTLVRAVKLAIQNGTLETATLRIAWGGDTAGQPWEECEVLVTAINVSSSTSDVVTAGLEFQRSGEPAYGTFGA